MSSSYTQHQNYIKNTESKSKPKLKSKSTSNSKTKAKSKTKSKDKEDKNNNYISYQNNKTQAKSKSTVKQKDKEDKNNNYISYLNNKISGGEVGRGVRKTRNNNFDSSQKKKKNIFDLCKMVENYIFHNCQKHKISPADLYEEMHYQFPQEWIMGLRFVIKNSERQQLKIDYDISQTDSNTSSEI